MVGVVAFVVVGVVMVVVVVVAVVVVAKVESGCVPGSHGPLVPHCPLFERHVLHSPVEYKR